MLTIKVSSGDPTLSKLLLRQTLGSKGIWGNCRFIVNKKVDRCDCWIVCHSSALQNPESTICDPNHIVYISMEPSEQCLSPAFLKQFSQLVLCDRTVSHPNIKYTNGTTWWVGMSVRHENGHHFSSDFSLNYDTLKVLKPPVKQNRISVVCSNNDFLPGHTKRLAFLEKLMANPVSQYIDYFGGGHRPIPDKWDAIAPYKYHLALENSVVADYWTEKLGDSYLGFALPLYYGCPNIHDYFAPQALKIIDIDDFDKSVAMIEEILENDPYEAHFAAIVQARNRVLDEYNIFQLMADICKEPSKQLEKCKLKPRSHFERSWPRRIARKIIYNLRGIEEAR